MTAMQVLADAGRTAQLISTLAQAIEGVMARSPGAPWALVGIRRRGDLIAQRLAAQLDAGKLQGRVGSLDITLYRDDLSEIGAQPVVRTTDLPFALDGVQVVLVDDVLMSGRSVRAALQSLMDLGRPARVWLAVLVDRGGRELPIEPDVTALDLRGEASLQWTDGSRRRHVEVRLTPIDDADAIVIEERPA